MTPLNADGTDREKRWMLLASTGDHSWLGRHSDPSDEELAKLAGKLNQLALSGWLCIAEGDYWADNGHYAVMEVKRLAGNSDFQGALNIFNKKRAATLCSP
jgi:hypothetical protein